ncbi:MAG: 1-deoxy-D-xylulose-5-phosphate reductoisomerase [Candidatus Omnitrophica bacterium]|nr:1-deoxy-D-xylulose-5-phosphate reductoisomerase [Candidatus Omnitrophota bacterium]
MNKKRICVLGSTGSIGRNALKVIEGFGGRFEVSGLSAGSNMSLLLEQVKKFKPKAIAIGEGSKIGRSGRRIGEKVRLLSGKKGLEELAGEKDSDIVLVAVSGSASIRPTFRAVSAGKTVALASKEALVSAGHIITREAVKKGSTIIPVDSEHSAVFQCLLGSDISKVAKLYITASGGPLWNIPKKRFMHLSRKEVLRHPKWRMGKKISVDSATMVNKGLELIEAKWLFGIDIDRIEVLIHPEAIVHSMVEFIDGSVIAQLGITDMRLPIQYALSYPERFENSLKKLDLTNIKKLSFYKPDLKKFPSLQLAYDAARDGGSAPSVLNSSNEAAVDAFLRSKIKFTDIPKIIEKMLSKHKRIEFPSLDDIDEIERWVESEVGKFCSYRS